MAYIKIEEIWTLGLTSHTHTSYEIYQDVERTILLDSNYNDPINLLEWHTPILQEDGSPYMGPYPLYSRVQLTGGGVVSKWYDVEPCAVETYEAM